LAERRYAAVLVFAAVLLAVVSTVLGGCGGAGASDPVVRGHLEQANAHLQKASGYTRELASFKQKWTALLNGQLTTDVLSQLRALLVDARKSEEAALGEVKRAYDELSSIKALNINSTMKTYIDMKLKALSEQEKNLSAEIEAIDLRIKTVESMVPGAPLDQASIVREQQIDKLDKESKAHAQRAVELNKKANAYYEKTKMGK